MRFGIEHQGQILESHSGRLPAAEELDEITDRMLDVLLDSEGIEDPDVTVKLATGEVIFTFLVEADNVTEALKISEQAVKNAVQTAGLGEANDVEDETVELDAESWAALDWHIKQSDRRLIEA